MQSYKVVLNDEEIHAALGLIINSTSVFYPRQIESVRAKLINAVPVKDKKKAKKKKRRKKTSVKLKTDKPERKQACKICGDVFTKINGAQVYCSDECADIAREKRNREKRKFSVRECPTCHTLFNPEHGEKYCSTSCRDVARKKRAAQQKEERVWRIKINNPFCEYDHFECWNCEDYTNCKEMYDYSLL